MLALVIESRPRSIRYALHAVEDASSDRIIGGEITEIGSATPLHVYDYGPNQGRAEGATRASNHREAFARIASVLSSRTTGQQDYTRSLAVVAHRVAHGGERFREPVIIDDEVIEQIDAFSPFAPQGNPAALEGIRAGLLTFANVPHVAVFDTAFHQSMPPEAYLYALPYELYERRGLRRFGFHSIAHRHAIATGATEVGVFPEAVRVVSLNIGEETTASAFANGRCVDTSSGLTAQSGLPGGTTAGGVDAAAITYLLEGEGMTLGDLVYMLDHSSGLLGLSGVSGDWAEVEREALKGDERCQRALGAFIHQIVRAVGGLVAVMGGMDLLVFTGTAGASYPSLREAIGERLAYFGVTLDHARNQAAIAPEAKVISSESSLVKVVAVRSDDEETILRDALELVKSGAGS